MKNSIKSAKYGNKEISELVNVKGAIFSMIKDGYEFDDEVLEAAHIQKTISNVKCYCRVGGECKDNNGVLKKETQSIRQIISEMNTLDNYGKDDYKDDDWSTDINNYETVDDDDE